MITRLRRLRLRLGWRTTIGIAGLTVLTIGGGWWRATSIVNRLLRDWAVGVVAQQSAGVYQLDPIGVHVNWFLRRVVVDSFRLTTDHGVNSLGIDLTSDKRRPKNPSRRRTRTPQQWIADLDLSLHLDSVVVRNGEVVYREQAAGRTRPGVMTFTDIQATAVNVIHRIDRGWGSETMSRAAGLRRASPTCRCRSCVVARVEFWAAAGSSAGLREASPR